MGRDEIKKYSEDTKIGVLCGGLSSEKEVSLRSGKNVYEALKRLGYKNAEMIVVDENISEKLKLKLHIMPCTENTGKTAVCRGYLKFLK